MANGAVRFVLETLSRLLREHVNLIENGDDKIAALNNDLLLLRAILEDSASSHRKNATLKEAERQIRNINYEIEDAIDRFIIDTNSGSNRHKGILNRFRKAPIRYINVARHVEDISERVKRVKEDVLPLQARESQTEQLEQMIKTPGVNRNMAMVGFEEEQKTILNHLCKEEKEELDVISIVGLPGVGKTALAYKIFTHPEIEAMYHKSHRIWVNVSHGFQSKDVLLSILSYFTTLTEDITNRTNQDISRTVCEHLGHVEKFLIVIDDVWSVEAWTDLKGMFTKSLKAGNILITSQLQGVSGCSNITVKLGLLSFNDSLELLRSEVFGNSTCPRDLESSGQVIANKCDGLPLLIVMIGKILKGTLSNPGTLQAKETWEQVSTSLCSYLSDEDIQNSYTSFYDRLPYELRPCLLYAGMFPEKHEIPVRKLTRLWIAEGFVHKVPEISLEHTARDYFNQLINRNLVTICKKGPDGHIKTCRVHYMLREFCKRQASIEKENVFQQMKFTGQGRVFEPSNLQKHRRLCINSNINDFFLSMPSCPLVRSFMCFSEENEDLLPDNISSIPRLLKLLRVLEAKVVTFNKLPADWSKLALLRYVVLSIKFEVIPKVISKLQNMQTLIVYTTSSMLEIEANIWKMRKLKHVETNVSTKLPGPKKGMKASISKVIQLKHVMTNVHTREGQEGNELQTLGMISYESCTEDLFDRLHNLQKLGICGQLGILVKAKILNQLQNLEKLKLVNTLPGSRPHSQINLQELPSPYEFPPKLKRLTLHGTKLDWSQMIRLERLTMLEVLRLKKNAFQGNRWDATSIRGFNALHVLHIEDNDFCFWTASASSFPELRCLMLSDCKKLVEIPFNLKNSLQRLYLKGPFTDSAFTSAKRIEDAKKNDGFSFELCFSSDEK